MPKNKKEKKEDTNLDESVETKNTDKIASDEVIVEDDSTYNLDQDLTTIIDTDTIDNELAAEVELLQKGIEELQQSKSQEDEDVNITDLDEDSDDFDDDYLEDYNPYDPDKYYD